MTRQEQIEEIAKIVDEMYNVYTTTAEDIAEGIYNAGYRKIDDFEECRKCPAWSGTDCTRNPYTDGCLDDKVNLKNEIKRLKKENEQLKAKLKARLTCDFVRTAQKHAVQDFAEKVKKKAFDKNLFNDWAGTTYVVLVKDIDELLKEYE